LLFANVTQLSDHATDFLLDGKFAIRMGVETHRTQQQIKEMHSKAAQAHCGIVASPATPSERSETGACGGAITFHKNHLSLALPAGYDIVAGRSLAWSDTRDLTAVHLPVASAHALVIGGYFACGGCMSPDNMQRWADVDALTRSGAVMFILIADFNDVPENIAAMPWLDRWKASVVVASGGDTCFAKDGSSTIDFAIVSTALLSRLQNFRVIHPVPFGPHLALGLTLRGDYVPIFIRSLVAPRRFCEVASCARDPAIEDRNWTDIRDATEVEWSQRWDDHLRVARPGNSRTPNADLVNHLARFTENAQTKELAVAISADYWRWSIASEDFLCARAALPPAVARKFRGRGGLPTLKWLPLWDKPVNRYGHLGVTKACGRLEAFWLAARNAVLQRVTSAKKSVDIAIWTAQGYRVLMALLWDDAASRALAKMPEQLFPYWARMVLDFALVGTAADAHADDVFHDNATKMLNFIDVRARDARRAYSQAACAGWSAYVSGILEGSAGPAHRFIAASAALPGAPAILRPAPGEPLSTNLAVIADSTAESWEKSWQREGEERDELFAEIAALRRHLIAHPQGILPAPPPPKTIREALATFSATTGIGIDLWRFTELALLPDAALADLGDIMWRSLRDGVLPVQCLLPLLVMLGKSSGGTRLIALLATLYRLTLAVIRPAIRRWDGEQAGFWDSAVGGRSCLLAGMRRTLQAESALELGYEAALALWDMKGFYDSVRISHLIAECKGCSYPLGVLLFCLIMHTAPRALKLDKCISKVVVATRSILAGCLTSTSMARALLKTVLARMQVLLHGTSTDQHVDDLSQVVIARSKKELEIRLINSGRAVAKAADTLQLELSTKSTLLPASSAAVQKAVAVLHAGGVPVTAADSGKDVGLGVTGRNKRDARVIRGRTVKARPVARRTALLGKRNREANKLICTNIVPRQQWGHQCQGASPAQIHQWRANMATAARASPGSCLATVIAWSVGGERDPAVACRVEQLKSWMQLYRSLGRKDRLMAKRAWRRRLPRVLRRALPWTAIHGPGGATQRTLIEAGWMPTTASEWRTHDGLQADFMDGNHLDADILMRFGARQERMVWSDAASHYCGAGLDEGTPCLDPVKHAHRTLVKHGKFAAAASLQRICCGGGWTRSRYDADNDLCPLCGETRETPLHRFYTCKKLGDLGLPEVTKTQWAVPMAVETWLDRSCLWGRGIVPSTLWNTVEQWPTSGEARLYRIDVAGDPVATWADADAVYSDGAGGPKWVPNCIRQAGAGAAAVTYNDNGVVTGASILSAQVPGRQTVPRGEVFGAFLAVRNANPAKELEVVVDATYVLNGACRFLSAGDLGPLYRVNGDVWKLLFDALRSRTGGTTFSKIKSHTLPGTEEAAPFRPKDVLGNAMADVGADRAADELFRPIAEAVRITELWATRAYLIALRIAAIEQYHLEHYTTYQPVEMPAPAPSAEECRDSIATSWAQAGHDLVRHSGWVRCTLCFARRRPKHLARWAATPCPGAAAKITPPVTSAPRAEDTATAAGPVNEATPDHQEAVEPTATPSPGADDQAACGAEPRPHPLDDSDAEWVDEPDRGGPDEEMEPEEGPPGEDSPPLPAWASELSRDEYLRQASEAKRRRTETARASKANWNSARELATASLPTERPAQGGPATRWSTRLVPPGHPWANIDDSHVLHIAAGTWVFCKTCGTFTSSRATAGLVAACDGTRPKGGDTALRKLMSGASPYLPTPRDGKRSAAQASAVTRPPKRRRG